MGLMNTLSKRRSYRIASYNMRKARGLDGKRDPGRIVDLLNGLDADVVALQEADRRLGNRPTAIPKELIAQATDFDIVPVARNDVSIGWHGNAILVRRGIGVKQHSCITLPGAEPRGAVAVTLEDDLTVIGVHLGLLRGSRRKQLDKLVGRSPDPQRTVLIGDMNEWSPSKGFEALQQDYVLHSPGLSFHAARPMAALDRIALSNDMQLNDAGVVQTAIAKRASDHLPIWADVATAAN